MSDHGHSVEERTFGGGGSAGHYRGAKFSLFEGGIRVPAVVSWPAGLPLGVVRNQMATGCDWLPTLADWCGISVPADLDGRSLNAVIREGAPSPHESFGWEQGRQWAIRRGEWKLLSQPNDPTTDEPVGVDEAGLFLVNLLRDPGEQQNLAAEQPELVERLLADRKAWVSRHK
jgi:arylsulfatase A-like enzyme